MKKSLLISEQDSIAALLENERVVEFFVNRGELLLGDIYSATVENILPGIDAAFVNLGKDKMGFLHANDVPGQGPLKERLVPKQKLLVQITKEPTGHKGPRVSTAISLPGRFLVLVPEERGVSISRRISEARERARLKSVVNLLKPPGVGLIIRTEAKGQGENELFEDFEGLWDRWQTVVSDGEASIGPTLIYRDQDLLYRVIRDAYSHDVTEIICDTQDGQRRAQEYLHGWAGKQTKVSTHAGDESILVSRNVDKEIEAALSDRIEMPSGGHLNIQPTEALTVIDVNSGRFTSSRTQAETVRRTNLEAAQEIPRQLRLRNIGGMVIVDFIDMDSRKDQQQVLEVFQRVLEEDRAKPQVGQLSDLGLVELTRRRQGQSLRELFTMQCNSCAGLGVVPNLELGHGEHRRVITFKSKDDEVGRGRNSQRRTAGRQQGVLRAASASNGRIMPTVEEEVDVEVPDYEDDVPEDILAQMPDELLMDDPRVSGKTPKRGVFNTHLEDDLDDGEDADVTVEVQNTQSFAPSRPIFEEGFTEDDESSSHDNLTASISAVEQVYQDMDARSRTTHVESIEPVEPEIVTASPIEMNTLVEPDDDDVSDSAIESEEQEDLVSFATASPYETVYDAVTGIYSLKLRAVDEPQSHATAHSAPSGDQVETVSAEEYTPSEVTAESHEVNAHSFNEYDQQTNQESTTQSHENVETMADEFEGAEWRRENQTAAAEDQEESAEREDSTPPLPQETHNS